MKKFISISIVTFIIFELCGVFILFKIQQQIIKYSAFQQIKTKNFQQDISILRFNEHEFKKLKWTESNKEFEYHQTLYDLVSIEKKNDIVVIYCINDTKENQLILNFYHWLKEDNHPYDIPFKELAKLFQINFFMPDEMIFQYHAYYTLFHKKTRGDNGLCLAVISPTDPPPKC